MVTSKQLGLIAPNLKEPKLSLYAGLISKTMDEFGIDTNVRMAHFLAQVLHESMECVFVKELASGSAYEGRKELGNTSPGDGVKYKGRGLIQITGKANYALLSKAFGVDFVNNPTLLETPEYAARSAGWFWKTHNLNKFADINTDESFKTETKRINGGLNGLADRVAHLNKARSVLC